MCNKMPFSVFRFDYSKINVKINISNQNFNNNNNKKSKPLQKVVFDNV